MQQRLPFATQAGFFMHCASEILPSASGRQQAATWLGGFIPPMVGRPYEADPDEAALVAQPLINRPPNIIKPNFFRNCFISYVLFLISTPNDSRQLLSFK